MLATTQREMATSGGTEILANFVGHGNPYYVLWSIERVAVAYDLQTIGNVDWYEIAAQYLLPAQNAGTGAWHHAIYDDDINTAFAILILKKANFISELTGKIRDKVSDPGRAELRAGGAAPLLFAPPTPAPKRLPPPTPVALPAFPNGAPEPRPKLPATVDLAPAEQFAQTLIGLDDVQWPQELKRLKSARGGLYTVALAWSIPRLEGARHKQARMTLAERLAYMTPATLRNHLRDPDPEIRRAAALACAMRADRSHIPDLIARITDPSDPAVQASRAGLRSLTGEDFGPDPGAADAAKLRAATDWQKWYETHQLPR
ncbi:MAG: HEAT repeat domain-containing protein [Bacteroidales bacterium]|nr:HEAT repeat domain-containing protein [Bacteroidales bacterium]